jgi:hypothetical protein
LPGAVFSAPSAKLWWINTPGLSYPYNTITSEPMNDYFSEALGIDPDDYPGEWDGDDEVEQEERHPSLTAEERNS